MLQACSIAIVTCAVVYTLAANFGYLTFGDKVADDLLLSYDGEHRGAVAVKRGAGGWWVILLTIVEKTRKVK